MKHILQTLSLAVIIISVASCASSKKRLDTSSISTPGSGTPIKFESRRINEIVVAPLEYEVDSTTTPALRPDFSQQLANLVTSRTSLSVQNAAAASKIETTYESMAKLPLAPKEKALRLARQLGTQGVIYGSVRTPAQVNINDNAFLSSVAIQLWLLDTASGQIVWEFTYSDRNKSLSENILAINKFGSSRSSQQMMTTGFELAADELEKQRTTIYTK